MKKLLLVTCAFLCSSVAWAGDDMWMELSGYYGAEKTPEFYQDAGAEAFTESQERLEDVEEDTWAIMQKYYSFSGQPEPSRSSHLSKKGHHVERLKHKKLGPYRRLIAKASHQFDIPQEVIGAVIMVESAGNSLAKAKTSSAKGLMQTIDATFQFARAGLSKQGIFVKNNPYDPEASIMAGSWYLNHMFRQMASDNNRSYDRSDLLVWKRVAEYYYAGPKYGRKASGRVVASIGGKRVLIDKAKYAQKVMRWMRIIG